MRHVLLAGAFAAGLFASAQAASAATPTADEIIAKQVAARGGADKIAAIKTLRLEGELIVDFGGGSVRLSIDTTKARPGKVRQDATIQGLTIVQAYDGAQGWQIQPFQGRKDAEAMSPDDAKDLIDDADIDTPLADYKAKGSTVEYLGTEEMDGTPAYKIRLTEKTGDQILYYIDTDSLMTIRTSTRRLLRGHEQTEIADLGDYEQVAGVYFPFQIEQSTPGQPGKQTISFSKGEANVAAPDALFTMPKSAK